MIRVPGRCVYLAAPSTGSRSTEYALVNQCGGIKLSAGHHARASELQLLEGLDEPVITVMRDPVDFVISRYMREAKSVEDRQRIPLEKWIPNFARRLPGEPIFREVGANRLMAYQAFADHVFRYEDGLRALFAFIGFPDVELREIGKWEHQVMFKGAGPRITRDAISAEAHDLIAHHFSDEIAAYRKLNEGR